MSVFSGGEPVIEELELSGREAIDLELHDTGEYGTASDTYGVVKIEGDDAFAESMRLRFLDTLDFVTSTPVR